MQIMSRTTTLLSSAVEPVFDNEPHVDSPDGDVVEVMCVLNREYENKHFPPEAPDSVEAIKPRASLLTDFFKFSSPNGLKYQFFPPNKSEIFLINKCFIEENWILIFDNSDISIV